MLAAALLAKQGVEVLLLSFKSCFFGVSRAGQSAAVLGLPWRKVDFTEAHLEMVKHPPHGYGRNMNPCIDCHAMMFRYAGRIMEEEGYDFLFSGEVLGQRPMSQTRNSLIQVARLSGYRDFILRPLSARILEETPMERNGLVDRERLGAVSGRSRKPQMELASRLGITEYPSSAGGCLLTDPVFSERLRELFRHEPDCTPRDVEFLKLGRQFWIGGSHVVVGRTKMENERLVSLVEDGDLLFHTADVPGALVVLRRGEARLEREGNRAADSGLFRSTAALALRYSKLKGRGGRVNVSRPGGEILFVLEAPGTQEAVQAPGTGVSS